LLLIKKHDFICLFVILTSLFSCGKKDEQSVNLNDPVVVKNIADKVLADDVKFSSSGNFTFNKYSSIVAGTEVAEKDSWGISFSLIEDVDGEFKKVFKTTVLDGSFSKCLVDKIKLSSFGGEMIYYNSKDYFMGTGGGDVYSYIIDFRTKKIYSAHLITGKTAKAILSLSDNVEDKLLREFFISYFKKDYPSLRISQSDN